MQQQGKVSSIKKLAVSKCCRLELGRTMVTFDFAYEIQINDTFFALEPLF